MAAPLSNAPPPPPTAEQRAQRRRQKRLVGGTLLGILVAIATWQVFDYMASAPERAEEQVQAGMEMLTPGRYEQAVAQFTQALETDPRSWNAYLRRGIAKQNLAQPDEALADFERALRINPDLLEARTARAEIYRQKGDPIHAIEELTKVIELKPSVEAHNSRALAYAELGQHEKAIPDFTWIIEQLRDAPNAYFARAKSKRALGDEAGAVQDEKRAMSFNRGVVH
jgi:tetratricopeptide (TPR) repeat protein